MRCSLSSSLLKNKKHFQNYFPVSSEVFYPVKDKKKIRISYNIPSDKIILSFGAKSFSTKRKGINFIIKAINYLYSADSVYRDKILIIYIGNKNLENEILFPSQYFGLINRQELSNFYNISDIFISASLQDTDPLILCEVLMCGVPAISFPTGVATDIIEDGINGYITESFDSIELAKKLLKYLYLSSRDKERISNNARTIAIELFEFKKSVAYLENIFLENLNN